LTGDTGAAGHDTTLRELGEEAQRPVAGAGDDGPRSPPTRDRPHTDARRHDDDDSANKELVRRLYGGLMAKGDTAVAEEVPVEDDLDHDILGVGQGGRQELVGRVDRLSRTGLESVSVRAKPGAA
jgi:hypothetical protein